MGTLKSVEYIAPRAKEIVVRVAEIVCASVMGSTDNEYYTEEIYEW